MNKNKRHFTSLFFYLIVFCLCVFQANIAQAESFSENFSTTDYEDSVSTTANWDTSGLRAVPQFTSLTSVLSGTTLTGMGKNIAAGDIDVSNQILYLGGPDGQFLKYDIAGETMSEISDAMWGSDASTSISVIAADQSRGLAYILADDWSFYKYDLGADSFTKLTLDIAAGVSGSPLAIVMDSVNNKLYIGGGFPAPVLIEYDPVLREYVDLSGNLDMPDSSQVSGMDYDSSAGNLWMVGEADFGDYNINSGVFTNRMADFVIGRDSVISAGNSFSSVAINRDDDIAYLGLRNGSFLNGQLIKYDILNSTAEDIASISDFASGFVSTLAYIPGDNSFLVGLHHTHLIKNPDSVADVYFDYELPSSIWMDQFSRILYDSAERRVYIIGSYNYLSPSLSLPQLAYADLEQVAQSTNVADLAADTEITSATLNATTTANNGSTSFYLSDDGGASWSSVATGTEYVFSSPGTDLRWKATLTNDAEINGVSISYNVSAVVSPSAVVRHSGSHRSKSISNTYELSVINTFCSPSPGANLEIQSSKSAGSPRIKYVSFSENENLLESQRFELDDEMSVELVLATSSYVFRDQSVATTTIYAQVYTSLGQKLRKPLSVTISNSCGHEEASQPATCSAFTKFLGFGDSSPEVQKIQIFLRGQGFFKYPDITDYFGPITSSAVKQFQLVNKDFILTPNGLLTPTGFWGPSSIARANAILGCR